jgi:hypothetical protein
MNIDVEALYQAITDELVVLWGEPSDAISAQVRPIVARSIAERYARLVPAEDEGHEHEWERGQHMAAAFGIDGRRYACAICGVLRPARLVPAEDEGRLREWLDKREAVPWSRGFSDEFKRGYEAAFEEFRAALAATPEPR